MAQAALVHFGAFEGASRPEWYDRERPWRMAELPSLCALGVACGLGGAGFIALNVRLTRWRRRHVTSRRARLLEALLASLLTTTCIFWAPLIAPCRPTAGLPFALLPDSPMLAGPHCDARAHGGEEDATPAHVSVLASLLLHPLDHGVRILFHTTGALPAAELFGCALLLLWLACCAYGLSVPSGIFVPTSARSLARAPGAHLSRLSRLSRSPTALIRPPRPAPPSGAHGCARTHPSQSRSVRASAARRAS